MKIPNILSLDISTTSTGITVIENGKYYFYSIMNYEEKKLPFVNFDLQIIPKSNNYLSDAGKFSSVILKLIEKHNINKVILEDYSFGSQSSTRDKLTEFSGIIKYHINSKSIPIEKYPPKQVKKSFTGNGNANKKDMFNAFINLETTIPFQLECKRFRDEILILHKNGEFSKIKKPYEDIIDSFAITIFAF